MSGECYSLNEPMTTEKKFSKGRLSDKIQSKKEKTSKDKLSQLLEYENMVSSAEDKCTLLKGQLERIKQLYNNSAPQSTRNIIGDAMKSPTPPTDPKQIVNNEASAKVKTFRQNSTLVETDRTGAALSTINNILTGITKPIIVPPFYETSKQASVESTRRTFDVPHPSMHGVANVKINSKAKSVINSPRSKTLFKTKRTNSKLTSKASSVIMKKGKKAVSVHTEKKSKLVDVPLHQGSMMNERSRKILKRSQKVPASYRLTSNHKDLVEIYHNMAVKESISSETDLLHRKGVNREKTAPQEPMIIPPLNINTSIEPYNELKAVTSLLSRNYELPTISSRMKKVTKHYMNSFNIKNIPFCPAKSINPSHNIGINFQQLMSMLKTKQQSSQHLSRTIAYNIGLVAGKCEPSMGTGLALLVSSVTSRVLSQCPLTKSQINYRQLQEQARNIPEHITEVDETEELNSPETQSIIITGPSGDVKVNNRKQAVWTTDVDEKKCTCIPPKGTEFQQIINKFNNVASKSKINKPVDKFKLKKTHAINAEPSYYNETEVQNKDKKLKEVLKKLHDDFEGMNQTYEELCKKAQSEETLKMVVSLEKQLNAKEEEIQMVITLRKEVLALKEQVKVLRERSSKESVSLKVQQQRLAANENGGITTGLLNKVLREIQHLHSHYKRT